MRQVRRHLLSGHFVLLASGSPQYIIDELAAHLRVHAAIGLAPAPSTAGHLPSIIPPVVFREGKREAVEKLLERWDLDLARSWLYSDSAADVPLFEAVGHPVVVNPKDPFRAEAERRGWPVVRWADRRSPEAAGRRRPSEWGELGRLALAGRR